MRIDVESAVVTDAIGLRTSRESRWHPIEAGGFVWAHERFHIVRLDPRTGGILDSVPVMSSFGWPPVAAHGSHWARTEWGIARVDLETAEGLYTLDVDGFPLAADGDVCISSGDAETRIVP